jgi:hypothetical protein
MSIASLSKKLKFRKYSMFRPTIAAAISIALLSLISLNVSAQPASRKVKLPDGVKPKTTKLCKVCAEWGKATPGTLFGPCVRYEYKPCTPPAVIR